MLEFDRAGPRDMAEGRETPEEILRVASTEELPLSEFHDPVDPQTPSKADGKAHTRPEPTKTPVKTGASGSSGFCRVSPAQTGTSGFCRVTPAQTKAQKAQNSVDRKKRLREVNTDELEHENMRT